MIDNIKFYIENVDVDEIEKNLLRYGAIDEDLDLVGLDRRTGISKYGATLNNAITISIKLTKNRVSKETHWKLNGHGSLHKFAKGNNYSLFTIKEAKKAIYDLGLLLGISLNKFVITNMEFAVNMHMKKDPIQYIDTIRKYRVYPFIYMKSLYKSSKLKGKVCKFTDYEIKFYDKTFEATHRNTHLEDIVPVNILRYEMACSRKKLKQLGLKNVTAEKLCLEKSLHYRKLENVLEQTLSKVIFHDVALDYTKEISESGKLSDDMIKDYIFAMSEDYDSFLYYIKARYGEARYKKEKTKKNALIKKMKPFVTNEHTLEVKSKFAEAIKLVSTKKVLEK